MHYLTDHLYILFCECTNQDIYGQLKDVKYTATQKQLSFFNKNEMLKLLNEISPTASIEKENGPMHICA
jgi:hypothetical protein